MKVLAIGDLVGECGLKKLSEEIGRIKKEMGDKIRINGTLGNRLPGNANISFKGIDGSELVYRLDEYNICVSSGSACSSKNTTPSHVLEAINVPEEFLTGAIRTSFGDNNTFEEINYLINCLKKITKNNTN